MEDHSFDPRHAQWVNDPIDYYLTTWKEFKEYMPLLHDVNNGTDNYVEEDAKGEEGEQEEEEKVKKVKKVTKVKKSNDSNVKKRNQFVDDQAVDDEEEEEVEKSVKKKKAHKKSRIQDEDDPDQGENEL